jgi:DNA-directed RNA polymerase subunit M/transcription elongation factor TFIIS
MDKGDEEINKEIRKAVIEKIIKVGFKKKISKLIEGSIFEFSIIYVEENNVPFLIESIYQNKADEIIEILSKKDSPLIKLIKDKKIDPAEIGKLKPTELNPDKYEEIIKKKELEEYKKNNQAANSSFKCSKCGNNKKFKVWQKQIRAGDEPITTFVECLECGHTFKF